MLSVSLSTFCQNELITALDEATQVKRKWEEGKFLMKLLQRNKAKTLNIK